MMALLSYLQTPALWTPVDAPKASAFFSQLLGDANIARINVIFANEVGIFASRWLPVIIVSAAAIYLLLKLGRDQVKADDGIADRLRFWAFAFGGICFFAYPLMTQDFWLSAVWGKMVVAGINPYYHLFTPELIGTLPLDHFPMTMSYGPLWALISGAIIKLSGNNLLATAILFKAVLLAAWFATLCLVDRLAQRLIPGSRALALIIIGWVPLGVLETVAEGHNDIFLALPALLWLLLLMSGQRTAPLALAASVLCKYTTAPLALLDALHNFKARRMGLLGYAARAIPTLIFAILVTAVFFRSTSFFDGAKLVDSWHFMQPRDAYLAITDFIGGWGEPLEHIFLAIFPAIAVYQLRVYWRRSDDEQLARLTLAIMCAVSFSMIGHVWSWYFVWLVPLAAVSPNWWLSRFVVGLCLTAPFTAVVFWIPEVEDHANVAALLLYLSAAGWALITAVPEAETVKGAVPAGRLIDFAKARGRVSGRAVPLTAFGDTSRLPDEHSPPVKAASGEV